MMVRRMKWEYFGFPYTVLVNETIIIGKNIVFL